MEADGEEKVRRIAWKTTVTLEADRVRLLCSSPSTNEELPVSPVQRLKLGQSWVPAWIGSTQESLVTCQVTCPADLPRWQKPLGLLEVGPGLSGLGTQGVLRQRGLWEPMHGGNQA